MGTEKRPAKYGWLHEQNEQRSAARRAEGKAELAPRDGTGAIRSRKKFIERRSRERRLARLRASRRHLVQGRRRLWGKGPPPPLFYAPTVVPVAAHSSPLSDIALCGSPIPNSPFAPAGADGMRSPFAPAGSAEVPPCASEPIDAEMLDLLERHQHHELADMRALMERNHFSNLARAVGVRI